MKGTNNINNSGGIFPPDLPEELKGRADAYEVRSEHRSRVSRNTKVANISGNAQETDSLLVPENPHNIDQNTSKNTSCFSLSSIRNMLSFCYNKVGLTGSYILSCFCSIPENIRNIPTPFSKTKAKDEEVTTTAIAKDTEVDDASSDGSEDDFVNRCKTRSFTSTVLNEKNIEQGSPSKIKSHSVKFGEQPSYIPSDNRSIESDTTPLIKERLSLWQRIGQSLTLNNIKTALSCSWLSRNERESIKAEVNDLDDVFSSSDGDEEDTDATLKTSQPGVHKTIETQSRQSTEKSLHTLFSNLRSDLEEICNDNHISQVPHQQYNQEGMRIDLSDKESATQQRWAREVVHIGIEPNIEGFRSYPIPFKQAAIDQRLPSTQQNFSKIKKHLQDLENNLIDQFTRHNLKLGGARVVQYPGDCYLLIDQIPEGSDSSEQRVSNEKPLKRTTAREATSNTISQSNRKATIAPTAQIMQKGVTKPDRLMDSPIDTLFHSIRSDIEELCNNPSKTFHYNEKGESTAKSPTVTRDCQSYCFEIPFKKGDNKKLLPVGQQDLDAVINGIKASWDPKNLNNPEFNLVRIITGATIDQRGNANFLEIYTTVAKKPGILW